MEVPSNRTMYCSPQLRLNYVPLIGEPMQLQATQAILRYAFSFIRSSIGTCPQSSRRLDGTSESKGEAIQNPEAGSASLKQLATVFHDWFRGSYCRFPLMMAS